MRETLMSVLGPEGGRKRFELLDEKRPDFFQNLSRIALSAKGVIENIFQDTVDVQDDNDNSNDIKLDVFSVYRERAKLIVKSVEDLISSRDSNKIVKLISHGSAEIMKIHMINVLPRGYLNVLMYNVCCRVEGITPNADTQQNIVKEMNFGLRRTLNDILFRHCEEAYPLISLISNMFFRITLGIPLPMMSNMLVWKDNPGLVLPPTLIDANSGVLGIESGVIMIDPYQPFWIYHISDLVGGTPFHVLLPEHLRCLLSSNLIVNEEATIRLTIKQALALSELVLYGYQGKKKDRNLEYWNKLGLMPQRAFTKMDYVVLEMNEYHHDDHPFGPLLYPLPTYDLKTVNGEVEVTWNKGSFIIPKKSSDRFITKLPENLGATNHLYQYQFKIWSESDFRNLASSDFQLDQERANKYDDLFQDFFAWEYAHRMIRRESNAIDIDVISVIQQILDATSTPDVSVDD